MQNRRKKNKRRRLASRFIIYGRKILKIIKFLKHFSYKEKDLDIKGHIDTDSGRKVICREYYDFCGENKEE